VPTWWISGAQKSPLAHAGHLPAGKMLPAIPRGGFATERDVATLPGAQRILAFDVAPGAEAGVYAFAKEASQRNLFRVPVP